MIPIHLDPAMVEVGLVGRGALAVRRLGWLETLGARPAIYSDAPSLDLTRAAGDRLTQRLPDSVEIRRLGALWIADLDADSAAEIANEARALGVLVNVEDCRAFCDFHTPAVVQRGGLLLTAGTGGASPAVAKAARRRLEAAFPAVWGEALAEIAAARERLRADQAGFQALVADAETRLLAHGLGPDRPV
jgi:precorrin-2 dehydrogenase/sirohydrochlorin ferrochelatase